MERFWILAQTDSNTPKQEIVNAEDYTAGNRSSSSEAGTKQPSEPNTGKEHLQNQWQSKNQWQSFLLIGLLFVVMYFVLFRGPKKRQQQQQQMIKSLKKNDRVQTVGGILGTVLEVSDNEITLKVDESNNTKIKVLPSSVSKVIE